MIHFVHTGSCALSHVGAHAHVATVAAVGSRCARTIDARNIETADAGVVRPPIAGIREGVVDAVVLCLVATIVVPIGDVALWQS